MKRLRYWLTALFVLVILGALWFMRSGYGQPYVRAEYLLDTRCEIKAWNNGNRGAEAAVRAAFDEVSRVHDLTNYYSPSSDVGKINEADAGETIEIDFRTSNILQSALEICERSGGAFDITIAPVKDLWNFSSEPSVPLPDELNKALEAVNWRGIELNFETNCVTKQRNEIMIDLGGAAKGYAADRAAEILRSAGIKSAIIDFGGNVVTVGSNPNSKDGLWKIGLQKPFAPAGEYGEKLTIGELSVVTSGNYERNFIQDGRLYHHILNPQTGFPAENGFDSVSIAHPSSLTADCLSTACFVLGEEKGRELAESYGAEIYFDTREN